MRSVKERRAMVEKNHGLSITKQCKLLQIHRSGVNYMPVPESEENLRLMEMMKEQYRETPFYGIRRLHEWLLEKGYNVDDKRVIRLMELINWQTLYPKRKTTIPNPEYAVYPYLLKGLKITRPNQVWAIDITYIRMQKGFMYLCAIIDLHSRYVVNWSISNTMSAKWCAQTVEDAIRKYGRPEIINSDQGSQFTSKVYIDLLESYQIKISMDGRGRAIDNVFIERLWRSVKHECTNIWVLENGRQLYAALAWYFDFYNHRRPHQALGYKKPAAYYCWFERTVQMRVA